MRKFIVQAVVAIALLLAPGAARAIPLGLGLVIDVSGSISSDNFTLQQQAYINALSDPILLPGDGTIAIGIWAFSTNASRVADVILLDGPVARNQLVTALEGMTQTGQNTCIGCGINGSRADLQLSILDFDRVVIDVSTDGMNNEPVNFDPNADAFLDQAVTNALAAGVDQINCLGVGGAADCSWIPAGSFAVSVSDFEGFEETLREKIGRETIIPEPSAAILMGLGLVALGGRRRRS